MDWGAAGTSLGRTGEQREGRWDGLGEHWDVLGGTGAALGRL